MQQIVLWASSEYDGMEYLTHEDQGGMIALESVIVGVKNGVPFKKAYALQYDYQGRLAPFSMVEQGINVVYTGDGRWQNQNGDPLPEFEGCGCIDIRETPFTNTLAIKQLRLEPGESAELDLVFFEFSERSAHRDRQRYTCIEKSAKGSLMTFLQLSTGFEVSLYTDSYDFIKHYPELFRRIYPKVSDNE